MIMIMIIIIIMKSSRLFSFSRSHWTFVSSAPLNPSLNLFDLSSTLICKSKGFFCIFFSYSLSIGLKEIDDVDCSFPGRKFLYQSASECTLPWLEMTHALPSSNQISPCTIYWTSLSLYNVFSIIFFLHSHSSGFGGWRIVWRRWRDCGNIPRGCSLQRYDNDSISRLVRRTRGWGKTPTLYDLTTPVAYVLVFAVCMCFHNLILLSNSSWIRDIVLYKRYPFRYDLNEMVKGKNFFTLWTLMKLEEF